jgi:hypothetical protein
VTSLRSAGWEVDFIGFAGAELPSVIGGDPQVPVHFLPAFERLRPTLGNALVLLACVISISC